MFLGGILESSACLSFCPSVCVWVQNAIFCQSAGMGIKSYLVTALVFTAIFESWSTVQVMISCSSFNSQQNFRQVPI